MWWVYFSNYSVKISWFHFDYPSSKFEQVIQYIGPRINRENTRELRAIFMGMIPVCSGFALQTYRKSNSSLGFAWIFICSLINFAFIWRHLVEKCFHFDVQDEQQFVCVNEKKVSTFALRSSPMGKQGLLRGIILIFL